MMSKEDFGELLDNLIGDALIAGIEPSDINRMLKEEMVLI